MLYKYVPHERLDILTGERIRATPPADLNDPFDLKPHFKGLTTEPLMREALASQDLEAILEQEYRKSPYLRKQFTLKQFMKAAKKADQLPEVRAKMDKIVQSAIQAVTDTPALREAVHKQMERFGVISFTSTPDNELMWAHYAASHTGIVIGVDESHPAFSRRRSDRDDFFHLREVVYRAPTAGISMGELNAEEVLLRKAPSWAYENEVRLLVPIEKADTYLELPGGKRIAFLNVPASAIREVIIGHAATAQTIEAARAIQAEARYRHLTLRRVTLDGATGGLSIVDL